MEINNREDLKKICQERLEAIKDQIPSNYLNLIFAKDPAINAGRVKNVRDGRIADLGIIKLLEEIVQDENRKIIL
jgi:hypothetical protein